MDKEAVPRPTVSPKYTSLVNKSTSWSHCVSQRVPAKQLRTGRDDRETSRRTEACTQDGLRLVSEMRQMEEVFLMRAN
jgi:hypothetical protein